MLKNFESFFCRQTFPDSAILTVYKLRVYTTYVIINYKCTININLL
jgi:hypothetical protein